MLVFGKLDHHDLVPGNCTPSTALVNSNPKPGFEPASALTDFYFTLRLASGGIQIK
jgi:hypothetical protein